MASIRWDFKGYRKAYAEYMRQAALEAALLDRAEAIAAAAGDGFEASSEFSGGRRRTPVAAVDAVTYEARRAEAKDRALTRALDAGRG